MTRTEELEREFVSESELSPRVARLETNYERLHEDVHGLKVEVSRGFADIQALIRENEKTQSEAHRPQYNLILQAISVVIVIGGLALWPVWSVSQDNKKLLEALVPEIARQGQVVVDNRQAVRDLDTNLQREMRDLDNQQTVVIEAIRGDLHEHERLGIHPDAAERVSHIEGELKGRKEGVESVGPALKCSP